MTNQNKNLCCNECFDEGVSQLSYGGCSNSKCICHTKQTTVPNEAKLTCLCGYEKGNGHSVSCPLYIENNYLYVSPEQLKERENMLIPAPSHTEEKCEHEVLPIAGEKGYVCLKCKAIIGVDIAKTDITEPKNPEYEYRTTDPILTGYAAPHTKGEEWVKRFEETFGYELRRPTNKLLAEPIKDFIRQELDTRGKQEYNRGYEYAKRNR